MGFAFNIVSKTSRKFGSHNIEKTRLLLLGCHSKTLDMVELILTYIDPKCIDIDCTSRRLYLSNDTLLNRNGTPLTTACAIGSLCKHLTTSHRPKYDATNNGDRPCLLGKLISAPELSKHLTIAQCPCCDA
jgi:hypothetical protein